MMIRTRLAVSLAAIAGLLTLPLALAVVSLIQLRNDVRTLREREFAASVVLGRLRGRSRASGEEFEVPFVHVWGLTDGVPSVLRAYFDPLPILRAL